MGLVSTLVVMSVCAWGQTGSSKDPVDAPNDREPTQDDIIFTRMDTGKKSVYQGEPVMLTMQLWRVVNRQIQAGPYKSQLNTVPTTEGFYVRELEPTQYEAPHGPWRYDVSESRKLLYASRPGKLSIGGWHFEAIALVQRESGKQRDKLYYKLDAGPIDIEVKPLLPAPPGFNGAVGQFDVMAEIDQAAPTQGVPFTLIVRVKGTGHPDAVGDPVLPALAWASVHEPKRTVDVIQSKTSRQPGMEKQYFYAVTPLNAGQHEIPEFTFTYFDPEIGKYVAKAVGPFKVSVGKSGAKEDTAHLIMSPEFSIAERLCVLDSLTQYQGGYTRE